MSTKLKALGIGFLAVMAMSAVAVMNASAESRGHFTSEVAHTTLQTSETETHRLELRVPGLTGIICTESSYEATTAAATVTEITVTPTYKGCETTGGSKGSVTVETNGCDYVFTAPNLESAKTEHTVDYKCPGTGIVLHHEGCEIEIHPINNLKGIGYTTVVENNKHAITLTANVTGFTSTFHSGFCILLGTTHGGELVGSATIKGLNTANEQVGITATGSVN